MLPGARGKFEFQQHYMRNKFCFPQPNKRKQALFMKILCMKV